jgi:hypothetical protein
MLLYLILFLAMAMVGAVFVVPFIRLNESRPHYLVLVVILLVLYDASIGKSMTLILPLGPVNVFPMDIICPLLLAFTFPVIFQKLKFGFSATDLGLLALVIWTCILMLNFGQGAIDFGIQSATNGFRSYLYTVSIALYLATRSPRLIWDFLEKAAPWIALTLILSAVYGYSDGNFSREDRPLSSGETLVLLQAFIIMVFTFLEKRLSVYWYPVLMASGPFVLLLQHRSVWLVALLSAAMMFCLVPKLRSLMLSFGVIVLILGSIAGFGFFGDKLFVALTESTQEAVSEESTLVWRYLGWKSLLTGEQMDSVREVALGNAFGSGWDRTITGTDGIPRFVDVMPHNYYIQTLLRSGLLGLSVFVAIYYLLISSLYRMVRRSGPSAPYCAVPILILLATQLIYFLPYGAEPFQALFIGCGIAVVGDKSFLSFLMTRNSTVHIDGY